MKCLLDDAGLSVGLVSLPFQQETRFFDSEIKPIFSRYVHAVDSHFRDRTDRCRAEFRSLYDPMPYYLFGRFDLAVLYLVDDHDFSCRTLRPFHPSAPGGRKKYSENFVYKVLFGPTPRFSPPTRNPRGIVSLVKGLESCPLLSLTQLKVNNSLLLGGGATFLRLVVNFIKHEWDESGGDARARLIILESYAWHEITLVMLGRSYGRMLNFAARLRDASRGDLVEALQRRAKARGGSEPEDLIQQLGHLNHLIARDLLWQQDDVSRAPLFGNLATNLGFDFRIFRNAGLIDGIDAGDRIHLQSRWFVKPGRMANFRTLLLSPGDSLICSVGRGDVWYPAAATMRDAAAEPLLTRDAIRAYVKQNNLRGLNGAALQRYTVASVALPSSRESTPRRRFSDQLRKLTFSTDELKHIDRAMRRRRVPKVLIHRLLNVYGNFNDGVLDRNLYASFAELRMFLVRVGTELTTEPLEETERVSHEELCRRIRKWVANFERAYRNRFHNSERMGEITDFNFDFKGGIQQVVTAFDAAYKALSLVLGARDSFVSVGADPGVDSTECEVRLNYLHVFQPEMFFAVAGKEASNWFATEHGKLLDEVVLQFITLDMSPDLQRGRDEFIQRFVEEALDRHKNLDPDIREQAKFWLPVSFFQTHFAELITYQACYAGNWELLCHWSLGSFAQMAGAYVSDGSLDLIEAARFLFRLRMIAGSLSRERFRASIEAFGDREIIDIYDNFEFTGQIEALRDAILDHPKLKRWFDGAREASASIAAFALSGRYTRERITSLQRRARREASFKKKELARGEVPQFDPTDEFSAFRFCQHVLYGYLLLLKEEWRGRAPRLRRTRAGDPRVPPVCDGLLFDPTGGVFAHEPETRRRLFKYRSAVTMSLWDMGQKVKRESLAAIMR
jgi:hypothetical protein